MEYTLKELEYALASSDDDLAKRDKLITSLTSQLDGKEMLQSRLNAAEEELKSAKSDQELKLSHAEAELKQSGPAIEHASDMFELRSEHDALEQDNSELKTRLLASEKALEE